MKQEKKRWRERGAATWQEGGRSPVDVHSGRTGGAADNGAGAADAGGRRHAVLAKDLGARLTCRAAHSGGPHADR
jgi:hypothetical protein